MVACIQPAKRFVVFVFVLPVTQSIKQTMGLGRLRAHTHTHHAIHIPNQWNVRLPFPTSLLAITSIKHPSTANLWDSFQTIARTRAHTHTRNSIWDISFSNGPAIITTKTTNKEPWEACLLSTQEGGPATQTRTLHADFFQLQMHSANLCGLQNASCTTRTRA
jgi:hypothetical protein